MTAQTWGEFTPTPALQRAVLALLARAALGEELPGVVRLREVPRGAVVAVAASNFPDHRLRMLIHPSTPMPAELRARYETTGRR